MFERTKALTEWATSLVACALGALLEVTLVLAAKVPNLLHRRRR